MNPKNRKIAKWTVEITSKSERFAQYDEAHVEAGSCGASHLNHLIASAIDGVPCDEPSISENGRLSYAKLASAGFKEALEHGLSWFVVRYEIEERFPTLPRLIQACLNAKSQIQDGEDWNQVLQKIANEARLQLQRKKGVKTVDWTKVEKVVVQSEPPNLETVPSQVKFVQKWGGGTSMQFVTEINDMVIQGLIPTDCRTSSSVYDAYARLELGPNELVPLVVIATFMAHNSLSEYAVDKINRFLTLGEIASIAGKKKTDALRAEEIIRNARKVASTSNVHTNHKNEALLKLYQRMTGVLFAKNMKDLSDNHIKDFATAAKLFVNQLLGETAGGTHASASVSADEAMDAPNVVEFDDEGRALNSYHATVLNKGFAVDQIVFFVDKDKVHQEQFKILFIMDDGNVTLAKLDANGEQGTETTVVAFADFLKQYKSAKQAISLLPYPDQRPSANKDFITNNLRAIVTSTLQSLVDKCGKPSLRVQEKPKMGVFALTNFETGACQLPPATLNINVEPKDKPAPTGKHYTASVSADGNEDHQIFLMKTLSKEFVAPIWCVRGVDKEDEVNCHVVRSASYVFAVPYIKDTRGKRMYYELTFDVVTNKKPLREGDELRIFQKVEKKSNEKVVMTSIGGANKRHKVVK